MVVVFNRRKRRMALKSSMVKLRNPLPLNVLFYTVHLSSYNTTFGHILAYLEKGPEYV